MKLLKLYSDNPAFKTITFNPGLNIVAGLQASDLSTDSFNGIGKSSSLHLLHLLFGGTFDEKIPSEKKLLTFLRTYGNIYLDFSIGLASYTIKKHFSENDFYLNNKKVSKTAWPKELASIFMLNNSINFNFKPLLNIFARRYLPEKHYYSGALTQQGQQSTDYYQVLYNLILLQIDTTLIKKNKSIAEELSKLRKTEQLLNKQKLTINEADYLDLKDELTRLEEAKETFVIAQNYDELKRNADILTHSMAEFRNKMHTNERDIQKKTRLLQASNHEVVDISRVSEIYNEAKFHFGEQVVIQLEQAKEFHLNLQKSRKTRLKEQVEILTQENNILIQELNKIETKRDLLLKDLDSKGALEEFNSIVERMRTLESEISELTSYQTVLTQFEKDKARLELDKAKIKAESIKQLEENQSHINNIEMEFRNLVKRFYRGHGGSFKITNSKDAQYLYNIEPHIPRDGSQGINEVKIFCYDLLLFSLNPNILGFIAHDSCIFNGVDPRQIATMFKLILEKIEHDDLQYFVNMNKNTYEHLVNTKPIEGIDPILTPKDVEVIENSKVLKLFDADPKKTLFGYSFG